MTPQNETEQLAATWRALDQGANKRGWQAIDVFSGRNCIAMAGRRAPGNEESLLVGIADILQPGDSKLPRGQGFVVVRTEHQGEVSGLQWLAIVRQQTGQLPLFALMAADLVALLRRIGTEQGSLIFNQLIARIKAWQHFMSRERPQLLTAEEEVGLVGELVVLRDVIAGGLAECEAIDAWVGPDDGIHDFIIGTGGVEVKATVAPNGFVARIGNLDQLDDSLHQPLYIGTVRLEQAESGDALPAIVDGLMSILSESGATELLASKLVSARYLESMRENYVRKFRCKELTYRLVEVCSPRLTRSNVPAEVLEAGYSLNLDAFSVTGWSFKEIAASLGVSKQWK